MGYAIVYTGLGLLLFGAWLIYRWDLRSRRRDAAEYQRLKDQADQKLVEYERRRQSAR